MRRALLAALLLFAGPALAQTSGTHPGTGGLQDPKEDARIYGTFGRNPMVVNPDGSINVLNETPAPAVNVAVACNGTGAASNANVTPPAGQYVYVTSLWMSANQDGTASVNTNKFFTSTNFGGANWQYSMPATPNITTQLGPWTFSPPMKSNAPGTLSQIKSPGSVADTSFCVVYTYYLGL